MLEAFGPHALPYPVNDDDVNRRISQKIKTFTYNSYLVETRLLAPAACHIQRPAELMMMLMMMRGIYVCELNCFFLYIYVYVYQINTEHPLTFEDKI